MKIYKASHFLSGSILVALSFGTNAQTAKTTASPFSYDFIAVGYDTGKLDLGSDDGVKQTANTTGFQFSKAITDTFFLTGNYGSTKISNTLTTYNLGVGARLPVSNITDVTAAALYSNLKATNFNPTGYAVSVGFRHALVDKVELGGTYYYSALSASGEKNTISTVGFEARYKVIDNLSVGLGYKSYLSDVKGYDYGLNARLEF